MTFADRYDILSVLNRGTVEVFAARVRANGQQVLAFIFPCSEPPANFPTGPWLLESFRKMAPEPPGGITDLGEYGVSSFAYLITRYPGENEVDDWLKQLRAYVFKPEEQVSSNPETAVPRQTPDARSQPSIDAPLRAGSDQASSLSPHTREDVDNSHPDVPAVPKVEPGDFTRQFFPEVGALREPHPNRDAVAKSDGSITAADFQSPVDLSSRSEPSSSPVERNGDHPDKWGDDAQSGQFTKLFSPRFESAQPGSHKPEERTSGGEFTKLFHAADRETTHNRGLIEPWEARPEPPPAAGFTQVFGPEEPPRREVQPGGSSTAIFSESPLGDPTSRKGMFNTEVREGSPADDEHKGGFGARSEFESSGEQSPTGRSQEGLGFSPESVSAGAAGATVIFFHAAEPTPADITAPGGPSPYTVFMQRGSLPSETKQPAEPAAPPSPAVSPLGAPIPTAVPAVPAFQPPAIPAMPVQMPAIAPPPNPAAQKAKSYWPLILIFGGLFLLAVLIVVYFLIKR